jgi:hypothetical protein
VEGTHNEEPEAIQKGDEEFKADQGYRKACEGNENGYQICTACKFVSYSQQDGSCAHR